MKERLWLMAFILTLVVGGLAIETDSQWWWFALIVPLGTLVYVVFHRNKKA